MASVVFAPLMSTADLVSIKRKPYNGYEQELYYSNGFWYGSDHVVIPEQGYKCKSNPNLQTSVSMAKQGCVTEVNTIVHLQAVLGGVANENWVGYFVDKTQSPLDAFSNIIDNLHYIQTQNWTMTRKKPIPGSPWITTINWGTEATLSYGDMAIVKCFNDANFVWNDQAMEMQKYEKPPTEYYTYEEQLDYVPIFVDFEGTELPDEVGVFINDVCKGATVVQGNLVEVQSYIVDDIPENPEIEIRLHYNSKSGDVFPKYATWNDEADTYVKQSLIISEKQDYYRVAINNKNAEESPIPRMSISNYPNPFNPITTIKFYNSEDAVVTLDVFNAKGQKVNSLVSGFQSQGLHQLNWNGIDTHGNALSNGIYFAVLKYSGKQVSHKMILMK